MIELASTPFWLLGISLAWIAYEEWDARRND